MLASRNTFFRGAVLASLSLFGVALAGPTVLGLPGDFASRVAHAEDQPAPGDPAKGAPPAAAGVKLSEAREELDRLKSHLKNSKADNGDIIASIETIGKAYHNLVANDEAGAATLEADREAFWKDADKELVKALRLVKPGTSNENLRGDVNIKAAQVLATTRPSVTDDIINVVSTVIEKAKGYEPPNSLYEEVFKAIGGLNDHKVGLKYMKDEWIRYDNRPGAPPRTRAAFEGLALFKDVPGKERLEIVKQTLRVFQGVEHAAETNKTKEERAQKEVWSVIQPAVIKLLQVMTKGEAKDDKGPFATCAAFAAWFRDNDKPNREPWTDPKKDPK